VSPWWLRPTAEGASENGGDEDAKREPAPAEEKAAEAPERRKAAEKAGDGGRRGGEGRAREARPGRRGDRGEKGPPDGGRAEKGPSAEPSRAEGRGGDEGRGEKAAGDKSRTGRGGDKARGERAGAEKGRGESRGEKAAGDRARENPAGDRAREKPAGDRAREKPAGDRAREKPAGDKGRGEKAAAETGRGDRGDGRSERAETKDERGGREERSRERGRETYTFDDEISTAEIEAIRREMTSAPERNQSVTDERKIAMFCDLENIALGVRDSQIKKFDVHLVLERLLEKGKIIVKKAYCDWERYSEYKRAFHEAAIEMIDIPQKYYSGKNSADIKMVVDAMDMSYAKEHLDTFVLLSGDSDFSPLVSKLKENNKYVIGIGVKGSSSNLLIDNCDEFIYYEDVWRDRQAAPKVDGGANKKGSEAFTLMVDAIQALLRENKDVLWGSMIKQTMQRKKPSFNEGYYGYSTFSELLEDAERNNLIKLKKDQRSGTYIVTGFSSRR